MSRIGNNVKDIRVPNIGRNKTIIHKLLSEAK